MNPEPCGWVHDSAEVVAVARFHLGGRVGYKARRVPGAALRTTRAEAERDACVALHAARPPLRNEVRP